MQSLDTNIVKMMAESLNFWLTKFVELVVLVCKKEGEHYLPTSKPLLTNISLAAPAATPTNTLSEKKILLCFS